MPPPLCCRDRFRARRAPPAPLYALATALAVTRLYLGVHYPRRPRRCGARTALAHSRRLVRPREGRHRRPAERGKSTLFNALTQAGAEAANYRSRRSSRMSRSSRSVTIASSRLRRSSAQASSCSTRFPSRHRRAVAARIAARGLATASSPHSRDRRDPPCRRAHSDERVVTRGRVDRYTTSRRSRRSSSSPIWSRLSAGSIAWCAPRGR